MALGLLLTFSAMASPVAAVEEGTVFVGLTNPIAKEVANYCIQFHNIGTLEDGDYIDIMFPFGTDVTYFSAVTVEKRSGPPPSPSPSCDPACLRPSCTWGADGEAVPNDLGVAIGTQTIRITLTGIGNITKCDYVLVGIQNVTNPTSCSHHLEVGTSAHTPVDSNPYTIYCAKIELEGGPFPATGLDTMNLISLPCYPEDTSIEVVLSTLFCLENYWEFAGSSFTFSVWYWDNAAKKWLKYVSDSSFADLTTIEAGKAYWIKPSLDCTIWIHGYPYPPGQGPPIKWCYPRCWNMVGVACIDDVPADEYLAYTRLIADPTLYAVMAIWDFDEATQTYDPLDWTISGNTTDPCFDLEAGEGYWMAFFEEACIIPPADCDC